MKNYKKIDLLAGFVLVVLFALFTYLVQVVDVAPVGVNETNVGFSALNSWFHGFCGVNMTLYTITDWAGLVPICVAFGFGVLGLVQLIKRRNLFLVDKDILILGGYYIIVAILYVAFEMIPINYRPILINGFMEVSYPSSTTLLVVSVMPTFAEQIWRRCQKRTLRIAALIFTIAFSVFMVVGRLISGVHWLTDIVAALLISIGSFELYRGSMLLFTRGE